MGEEKIVCPICGTEHAEGTVQCFNCGTSVANAPQQPESGENVEIKTEDQPELVEVEIRLSENPALLADLQEAGAITEEDIATDLIKIGVSKEDAEKLKLAETKEEQE